MASLNLLFVHEVNYQSKVIFEMHEFPELLAARGHQIKYLDFPEGNKFWRGSRAKTSQKIAGRTQPQTSIDLERPFTLGVPGLDRLLATITVIPKLISLLRSNRFDAIVLYAVPTYGVQVVWLGRLFGVPVIFRAIDVPHLIRQTPFQKAIRVAERIVYRNSEFLSSNNPALGAYCSELAGREIRSQVNLPPLDLNHFKNVGRSAQLAKELAISVDDKIVLYMGTFFHFSGLDQVLRDLARAALANPQVKLLLVGGGPEESKLRKMASDLGISGRVIFTGFVSYARLPEYLCLADVAINPMRAVDAANLALPHKVLQYLACQLPVVSTRLTGLYALFPEEKQIEWAADSSEIWGKALAYLTKLRPTLDFAKRINFSTSVADFERMLTEVIVRYKRQ